MAHELYIKNGKASHAYVGEKPWHSLGQELTDGASFETWKTEAGMDWEIREASVRYWVPTGEKIYPDRKVLFRSDTFEELSIVSDDYRIVQPEEVLEFFRDLVEQNGMKLNTAGVLFGGRRFWALADTGRAADILGNDRIKGMLLLTTSCDGTIATNAMLTSVRVVCNNTLRLALTNTEDRIRVTHRTVFDPRDMKEKLGLIDTAWESFMDGVKQLSTRRINDNDSHRFVYDLIKKPNLSADDQPYTVARDVSNILNRIKNGMGQPESTTLWNVLNGITEFCDHESRSRSSDKVLWNSWYGNTADLKTKAYEKVLELV